MFQKPSAAAPAPAATTTAAPAKPQPSTPTADPPKLGPPVVKLDRPIATHDMSVGGMTSELKFKPLTADVLIRYKKLPFTQKRSPDGTIEVETDFAIAAAYISDLTGVDVMLLSQMSIADFTKCLNALGGLLNDAGN